jgi:hypothetical protein
MEEIARYLLLIAGCFLASFALFLFSNLAKKDYGHVLLSELLTYVAVIFLLWGVGLSLHVIGVLLSFVVGQFAARYIVSFVGCFLAAVILVTLSDFAKDNRKRGLSEFLHYTAVVFLFLCLSIAGVGISLVVSLVTDKFGAKV